MVLFRVLFYILMGYLIIQMIRFVLTARTVIKGGTRFQDNKRTPKEKDISSVARILDETRLDKGQKKSKK
ncbi:MAG: hypothetical protein OEV66_02675 [Spirochaetia bacterium]|nr:hypothetical protein [Spirochaetia bacterium]